MSLLLFIKEAVIIAYLTFTEYETLSGNDEITEAEFNKAYPKAEIILDGVTSNFYQFNELSVDNEFRAERFKKALVAQIGNQITLNNQSESGTDRKPQSISIGSTTVNYGTQGTSDSVTAFGAADDVYLYLEGTGLLYRGVGSC